MPTYRVEVSPNNRAGCQDSVCKKEAAKIPKGEIRFGTWVEGSTGDGREFQSWKWRHWGCVSGKTMQNIRDNLTRDGDSSGQYAWDYMDGLEEMPEDLQNKVKNAIIEGKIADEDWKGDPEYNVLGKTGIRGRASAKKKAANNGEGQEGTEDPETPSKPPNKKRGRAKKDEGDEDDDDDTPVKKKRTIKAKNGDESEDEAKPAKKPRAKKAAKIEEVDGAKLMKKEGEDEIDIDAKADKKPKAKRVSRKEGDVKPVKAEDEADVKLEKTLTGRESLAKKGEVADHSKAEVDAALEVDEKPMKKSRAKKGVKKGEDVGTAVKADDNDEAGIDVKAAQNPHSKKAIKKEGPTENTTMSRIQGEKVDVKPARKARAKKAVPKGELDEGDPIESEKPDDPLEQIAQGFCNKKGPLNAEFNEMVDAGKVDDDDWGGFLEEKFGSMVRAGEFAQGDYQKFLQQMYTREVAALQSQADSQKKGSKAKKLSGAAAIRGRKVKVT